MGVKTHIVTKKISVVVPQKYTNSSTQDTIIYHSWAYSQRSLHSTRGILAQLCSFLLYLQQPERRNKLDVPQQNNKKENMVHLYNGLLLSI